MTMPRLSIARLMVLVAIVAADCWAVRNLLEETGDSSFGFEDGALDIALVPMATILAVGLVVVPRDRAQRPGFLGFQATGWAVLLVYVGFCVMAPERTLGVLRQSFVTFCKPLFLYLVGGSAHIVSETQYEELVAILLAIPLFTLPQLLVALCGGLLAHRIAKGAGCRS